MGQKSFISSEIRDMVGKEEVPGDHITSHADILSMLKENFRLRMKINLLTVSHIYLFEHRRGERTA